MCRFFYRSRVLPSNESEVDQLYDLCVFPVKSELGAWKLTSTTHLVSLLFRLGTDKGIGLITRIPVGIIMELSMLLMHSPVAGYILKSTSPFLRGGWSFAITTTEPSAREATHGFPTASVLSIARHAESSHGIPCVHPKNCVTLSYVWGSQIQDATISRIAFQSPYLRQSRMRFS